MIVTTQIRIDVETRRRLKVEAARRGVTMLDALAQGVEPMLAVLEANKDMSVKDWLDAVKAEARRDFAVAVLEKMGDGTDPNRAVMEALDDDAPVA